MLLCAPAPHGPYSYPAPLVRRHCTPPAYLPGTTLGTVHCIVPPPQPTDQPTHQPPDCPNPFFACHPAPH